MKIAEQLNVLRDFNQRRVDDDDVNDDNNDGNSPRPPRTPPPPLYDFPMYNTPLPLPPTMSDNNEIEQTPASRERVAIKEKVNFSENSKNCFQKLTKFLIEMTKRNHRLMMQSLLINLMK